MEHTKKSFAAELEERLINFTSDILDLADDIPKTYAGIYFAKQLIRSGSAPALLYGEVRAASSTKDFIHKMNMVLKELRETHINLKIIYRKFEDIDNVQKLIDECGELIAIFVSSVNTSKSNARLN